MQTCKVFARFTLSLVAELQAADGKQPLTPPGKKAVPVTPAKAGKAKASNSKEAASAEPEVPPPDIQVRRCSQVRSLVQNQTLVCSYWMCSVTSWRSGSSLSSHSHVMFFLLPVLTTGTVVGTELLFSGASMSYRLTPGAVT